MEKHANDRPVIALVLGSGWKLGVSFHAGVLLALRDVWGIDARSVNSVTGTSAGAVTAGFVGAGIDPDDLFQRETHAEHHGPTHDLTSRTATTRRSATANARDGSAVPRTLATFFDELMDGSWPSALKLRLCAVDARNGRIVALDADSGATPGEAIAASCSVPGVSRPVRIGERRYVDGAVRSVNNAGTVATTAPDVVVVSAPMSVDRPLFPRDPMALVRNSVRVQTARECRRLATTCQVISIEPSKSDVAAMGSNLNAETRREHVARHAYATACEIFEHVRPAPVPERP